MAITDEYHISIPFTVDPDHLPAIPGILARKGIREIDDKWAGSLLRNVLYRLNARILA